MDVGLDMRMRRSECDWEGKSEKAAQRQAMRLGLHQNQAQDKHYRPASIATSGTGIGFLQATGSRGFSFSLFFYFIILLYGRYPLSGYWHFARTPRVTSPRFLKDLRT